jgi:predicted ATPase
MRGKHSVQFATRYEELIQKTGSDPLVVLFKLLKCRTRSIQLQAAKELLQYRFPKLASAQLQIEEAGQMIMTWEDTPALDKPSEQELADLSVITGECETVKTVNGSIQ